MNIQDVMTAIGTQLDTIPGLRVYDYPAPSVAVPAAVVGYPDTITYDVSMGRGQDQLDLPVLVVVGKVSDRTVLDVLGPYLAGAGASSIKATLEANNRTYTAFSRVRVRSATVDVVTISAVEYLAGIFSLDIYGTGA